MEWSDLVVPLLVGLTGAALGGWLRGRRRRLAVLHGRVDCVLRVDSGEVRGLSRGWRRGRTVVQPGEITFRWLLKALGGDPVVISGLTLDPRESRPATFGEKVAFGDGVVHTLRGDGRTLGWMVPSQQSRQATRLLAGS